MLVVYDLLTFAIGVYFWEETGAMVVDIGVEEVTGELINLGGLFLWDMDITEELTDE